MELSSALPTSTWERKGNAELLGIYGATRYGLSAEIDCGDAVHHVNSEILSCHERKIFHDFLMFTSPGEERLKLEKN